MANLVTINQAIANGLQFGDTVKFSNGKVRHYRQTTTNFGRTMYRFTNSPTGKGNSYDGSTLVEVVK